MKITKVLKSDFFLFEKDDEATRETYEENEMLGNYRALTKKYSREDGIVILPAGTLLEKVEKCYQQGSPEIWKIIENGIELLVWDWD